MLSGKHILLGVTGSIAAYKSCYLVREFRKLGAEVKVVMTPAASQFVSPFTLSTLSGNEVIINMFPDDTSKGTGVGTWHIDLSMWADAMLIAPASANTTAKIAHGFADNFLTSIVLAIRCPLVVAPAMDVEMYKNPFTQKNIAVLKEQGYFILDPEEGELASGLTGIGRLAEPDTIVKFIESLLGSERRDLSGKKIIVTAGPTYEPVDPVRFIGNRSSGKMGFATANAAAQRGADVVLVSGPVSLPTPPHVRRVDVATAKGMFDAVTAEYHSSDAVVMAAAVADYAPVHPSDHKLKKEEFLTQTNIELEPTPDILLHLGQNRKRQILVGFALETENEMENAREKLRKKNLDLIVLNNPTQEGATFGSDTNIVTIIHRGGTSEHFEKMPKYDVANLILDRIVSAFNKSKD
jgi:phosphopantothenoylcysteine decarboxylase/phosphopantothenate--cysteine ligase